MLADFIPFTCTREGVDRGRCPEDVLMLIWSKEWDGPLYQMLSVGSATPCRNISHHPPILSSNSQFSTTGRCQWSKSACAPIGIHTEGCWRNRQSVQKWFSLIIFEKALRIGTGWQLTRSTLLPVSSRIQDGKRKRQRPVRSENDCVSTDSLRRSYSVKAEKRLEVATVTPQWLVIDRNGWSKLYNEREVTGSRSW